jgi:hypothetical protein
MKSRRSGEAGVRALLLVISIRVVQYIAMSVRQALIAGVIDELTLDIAPVLLGSGERIFDGVESFGFEPAEVLHSPLTTHIRYRRVR